MKLKDGAIIPGVSISNVFLNMDLENLELIIGKVYVEYSLSNGSGRIIKIENAKIWLSESEKVYQITVSGDYAGKFRNIGIGSTLADIEKFTEWKEEGTYMFCQSFLEYVLS